jgi:hypothetical protein
MAGVILSVQLVVYPGFAYFRPEDLRKWHQAYTPRITVLVAPLMVAQLLGGLFWTISQPATAPAVYLGTLALLWAMTFHYFIPLHRHISGGTADKGTLRRLGRLNGIRTFLWLFALAWHLLHSGIPMG